MNFGVRIDEVMMFSCLLGFRVYKEMKKNGTAFSLVRFFLNEDPRKDIVSFMINAFCISLS